MQHDYNSNITQQEDILIDPSQITLGFLMKEGRVKELLPHAYDIHIENVDFSPLAKICSKEKLEEFLKKSQVLSVDMVDELKLLDLSYVGLGFAEISEGGDESQRYAYLNQFVDCVNRAIDDEEKKEKNYVRIWEREQQDVLFKFKLAQCKNKVGFKRLYGLISQISGLIKRIDRTLLKYRRVKRSRPLLEELCRFLKETLYLNSPLGISSVFKMLGMPTTEDLSASRSDFEVKLKCYRYFLYNYRRFLGMTLYALKDAKIKRATDLFTKSALSFKKDCLESLAKREPLSILLSGVDYEYVYRYNVTALYDLFRYSLIKLIHEIVNRDIKRRKVIDGIFQYTPSAAGGIAFFVSLGLSFAYNFTLLKEFDRRWNLFYIYLGISLCAIIAAINLYRNAVQFKRPKRKRFSIISLISYAAITLVFFSLNSYYIARYDGYDDTYYYVDIDGESIKIDGLFIGSKESYVIPNEIDGKKVSIISKNTFRGNRSLKSVDLRFSGARLDEAAFKGCVNLNKVLLGPNTQFIPNAAFWGCSSLADIDLSYVSGIGESAFYRCKALKYADISNATSLGYAAFKNCSALEYVNFSEELSVIPRECFINCYSLTFDKLPQGLSKVEKLAFANCRGLLILSLHSGIEEIERNAFLNCENVIGLLVENAEVLKGRDLSQLFGRKGLKGVEYVILKNYTSIPDGCFEDYVKLSFLVIEGDVKRIGKNAFKGCSGLTSLDISGKCEYIGEGAFYGCSSLQSLSFGNLSVSKIEKDTFNGCKSLRFSIPATVSEIGERAFYGCKALSSLSIPASVKAIGRQAFGAIGDIVSLSMHYINERTKLKDFLDEESVKSLEVAEFLDAPQIPAYFFDGCENLISLVLSYDPESVGEYAFRNCGNLPNFDFIKSVKKLGKGAFYNCKTLKALNFSSELEEIPDEAFKNCLEIRELFIPETVKKIGSNAFSGCSNIGALYFGHSVPEVGRDAFSGCEELRRLRIPLTEKPLEHLIGKQNVSRIVSIEIAVVSNSVVPDNFLSGATRLSNISIDGTITGIGKYAFKDCVEVTAFEFIKDVATIGEGAFHNCSSLLKAELNESLVSIPDKAFYGCSSLLEISLPSNLTRIGKEAFYGCSSMRVINIPDSVDHIGDNAFEKCTYLNEVSLPLLDRPLKHVFGKGGRISISTVEIKVVSLRRIPDGYMSDFSSVEMVSVLGEIDAIGKDAFKDCTGLKQIELPDSLKEIGAFAFSKTAISSFDFSGIEMIGQGAFKGSSLKSIVIPDGVAKIGSFAFEECRYLESASFNENISEIADHLFKNCVILKNIEAPGVNKVGKYVFEGCSQLKSFNFSAIEKVGDGAFKNCRSLKEVRFKLVAEIGKGAFDGCGVRDVEIPQMKKWYGPVNMDYYFDEESLSNITTLILYDAKGVGKRTFKGLVKVKSIELKGEMEKVGAYAFSDLISLERVILPDTVKEIDKYAFSGCKNLSQINIPESLNSIGKRAFAGCESLPDFAIPADFGYVGKEAFAGTNVLVINAEAENQMNQEKWHERWDSREVKNDIWNFLEDNLHIPIIIGALAVGLIVIRIIKKIVKRRLTTH